MSLMYSLPFDHDSFQYQALRKYVLCSAIHSVLTESYRSILVKFTYVLQLSCIVRNLGYLEKVSARIFLPHFNLVGELSSHSK